MFFIPDAFTGGRRSKIFAVNRFIREIPVDNITSILIIA